MDQVSINLVNDARKRRRGAMVELLSIHYPMVWRMANGLTGRQDVGRGVVKFVMRRSLHALSSWADDGAPTRWFCHHTLLTTRRAFKHTPDLTNDTMLDGAAPGDPDYQAFIRALRRLPMQQREAFILSRGEGLDIRAVAVAMDCSTVAATNHLREADERLRELAAEKFPAHQSRMSGIYKKLGPDEELSITDIRRRVGRFVVPWIIKRLLRLMFGIVLLGLTIWGAWWAWRIVEYSMQK